MNLDIYKINIICKTFGSVILYIYIYIYIYNTDTAFDNHSSDKAFDHSQEGQKQSITVFMPEESTTVLSTYTAPKS